MERRLEIIITIGAVLLTVSCVIGLTMLFHAIFTTLMNMFCYTLLMMLEYPIGSILTFSAILALILSYESILKLIKK